MEVSFKTTNEDGDIISKIVTRAMLLINARELFTNRMSCYMDIVAVHANGNPLRLQDLLEADDFNFTHDIYGIAYNLDRTTGKLINHFSPRFTKGG